MSDQLSKSIAWNKSLRTKTFFALVMGVATLVATLYLSGRFYLVKSFEGLEQREGRATMERVRQAVKEQENFLLTKAQDWAYWDDAYKFVQDGNEAFKTSNLTDNALGNLKIHILVYLNAKNEVISFLQGNSEDFKPAPHSKGADLFLNTKSPYLNWGDKIDAGVSGIVMLPEGPALIVSRPVITSEQKGPVAGSLIFGQYLDKNLVKRISELTNLNLSLDELSTATSPIYKTLSEDHPIGLQISDADNVAGYAVFQDIFGKPAIGLWSPIPRELMKEGLQTISLFTNIVAGLGLLFVILMVLIIDRTMVARLIGLSGEVSQVAPGALSNGKKTTSVTVLGDDEVGLLANEINSMLSTIAKHSQAMTDIVENVSFGFFICDIKGVIRPGLTASCGALLEWEQNSLVGKSVTEAFRMNAKDAGWFMTLYGQLCEDIFPEETSLSQMPKRFIVAFGSGHRVVRLDGRLLRDESKAPRGVLFSVTDITELEHAEIENQEAKTLLKILQAPTAFTDFVTEMKSQVKTLAEAVQSQDGKTARRILHTLKGNFSCFDLEMIAREIHAVEDRSQIVSEDIQRIETMVRGFLNKNKAILHLDYDKPVSNHYTLSEQDIDRLEKLTYANQLSIEQKNTAIQALVADFRKKPVVELVGPLADMVQQTAAKLGKTVDFQLIGADTRVEPEKFKAVTDILPHLIRNSLDHGLELPEEREDGGKVSVGSIRLEVKEAFASADRVGPVGVQITLSDDGRGIDKDRVVKKALQLGLVNEDQISTMTHEQKLELVYSDSLSTAEEVSEISGRGFGMAAVRENILKAGGSIKIESKLGHGCAFVMYIPYAVKTMSAVKNAA